MDLFIILIVLVLVLSGAVLVLDPVNRIFDGMYKHDLPRES